MTEINQVYKCNICGNVAEVLVKGAGKLVCCGQPMELMEEKTSDEGQEKHVPVIKETKNGVKVKVGSVAHPMEEEHYIYMIEAITEGGFQRKFLKPGDAPEAEFPVKKKEIKKAREYCTVHGLWASS